MTPRAIANLTSLIDGEIPQEPPNLKFSLELAKTQTYFANILNIFLFSVFAVFPLEAGPFLQILQ